MDVYVAAFASLALWTAGFLALGVRSSRRARTYREALRAERVRGLFAEARAKLVLKALRGGLDPDSETYRTLYFLQTAMMRRDDQYGEIWGVLVRAVHEASRKPVVDRLSTERATWDAETKDIAYRTSLAINAILVEYSLLLRTLVPILRLLRAPARKRLEERVEDFDVRHRPERREIREFLPVLQAQGA